MVTGLTERMITPEAFPSFTRSAGKTAEQISTVRNIKTFFIDHKPDLLFDTKNFYAFVFIVVVAYKAGVQFNTFQINVVINKRSNSVTAV